MDHSVLYSGEGKVYAGISAVFGGVVGDGGLGTSHHCGPSGVLCSGEVYANTPVFEHRGDGGIDLGGGQGGRRRVGRSGSGRIDFDRRTQ